MITIESCSTPNGKISCELIKENQYGADVYSIHVYESLDNYEYKETHASYPVGNLHKAKSTYKQFCNRWLRNKR